MDKTTLEISAKDLVADIRSGMSDTDIMEKYGILEAEYRSFLGKLLAKGVLTESEIGGRKKPEDERKLPRLGAASTEPVPDDATAASYLEGCSLGYVLQRSFHICRTHFRQLLALVVVPLCIIAALAMGFWHIYACILDMLVKGYTVSDRNILVALEMVTLIVGPLTEFVMLNLVQALIASAVSSIHRGEPFLNKEIYRRPLERLPQFIYGSLLILFLIYAIYFCSSYTIMWARSLLKDLFDLVTLVDIDFFHNPGSWLLPTWIMVEYFGATLISVYVVSRVALFREVLVFEQMDTREAIKKSWQLLAGRADGSRPKRYDIRMMVLIVLTFGPSIGVYVLLGYLQESGLWLLGVSSNTVISLFLNYVRILLSLIVTMFGSICLADYYFAVRLHQEGVAVSAIPERALASSVPVEETFGAFGTSEEVLRVTPTSIIRIQDFLADVRSEMTDKDITEKYSLSKGQLQSVFNKLIQVKRLKQSEVNECAARGQQAVKLRNAKWGAPICLVLLVLSFRELYISSPSEAGMAFSKFPLLVLCPAVMVFLYRIFSNKIRNRCVQVTLAIVMGIMTFVMILGLPIFAMRLRMHYLFRDARQLMWSPIQCINSEQQKLGRPPDGIRECINEQSPVTFFRKVIYWQGTDKYYLDVVAWFHGCDLAFRYSSQSGTWEEKTYGPEPVSGCVGKTSYVRKSTKWIEAKE